MDFSPPTVSIIIPAFGHSELTCQCLESIFRSKDPVSREIVVVDDGSPHQENRLVAEQFGVRALVNETTQGCIVSTNRGIAAASADFLYLLNNDTVVTDSFLLPLLDLLVHHPDAGAVGSKLIYPDGRLQEAGCHVYKTGNAFNYGRGGDPEDFRYNFVRQVDYCSSNGLMIRKELFHKLGMLDDDFSPAYYEDVDFLFRLREAGWKVLYQPKAVIIHHEGATCGRDRGPKTKGLKRLQFSNREKFVQKHAAFLQAHCHLEDYSRMDVQIVSRGQKQIFFFETALPTPDHDAGSARTIHLLRILSKFGQVTFIPAVQEYDEPRYDLLAQNGIRVVISRSRDSVVDWISFLNTHRDVVDLIVLSRPEAGILFIQHVREVFGRRVPVIYDNVDLHCLRLKSRLQAHPLLPEQVQLAKQYEIYRSIETFLIMDADRIWAISEEEKNIMAGWGKPNEYMEVVPIVMENNPTPAGYSQRRDLLFIGSPAHTPNLDAIRYYQREIVPEFRHRGLDFKLLLVGAGWENIADLDSQRTQIVGFVQDLKTVFGHCLAAFFPLITGAGMKGKVATALGMGVPVITTPVGAEGYVEGDHVMMIGNTPAQLADHATRLASHDDLWYDLRKSGLRYVSEHLSPSTIQAVVEQSIKKLIDTHL